MDSGAHFFRCDFQVHTPRDLNWTGNCPTVDAERQQVAKDFIRHCRTKGIDAVAITDHHDTAFYRYFKDAARTEFDAQGNPVPEQQQIVVFPGMELTLGIPCQALLLLDSDFPLEFLPQVATALSLNPDPPANAKHAQVQRLDHFTDFIALHKRLDELSILKGRYIVLPNVNCGSQTTLQRQGFLAHYKSMPCVGGYLDHGIDGVGVGDRNILEGKIEAYGFKPLGIFPTSDSRSEDRATLGNNSVWVKWAKPTAEAIRQACLARKTRISHTQPQLPALVIESVHVSLSKFMGPIDLEFNPQFNCLIGGRGTGKSTILEYVRWGLCDQPPQFSSEDVPDFNSKRNSLIENTLVPHNATVTIVFTVNGVRHQVRRKTESSEILLKVGEEPLKPVTEQDIRELLPLQAYSQKQLSAVGVRSDELTRFVEAPVARRLAELQSLGDDTVSLIRDAYNKLLRKRKLGTEIARQEVELASLEKQLESLRTGLKGLSPDDQAVLKEQERYSIEQQVFDQWQRNVDKLNEVVRRSKSELEPLPARYTRDATQPNDQLLGECDESISSVFTAARTRIEGIEQLLTQANADWTRFSDNRRNWTAKQQAHATKFDEVRKRAVAHESLLNQISEVEARANALRSTIAERRETYQSQGTPETDYASLRQQRVDYCRQRATLLGERCQELSRLSSGAIRANLHAGGGISKVAGQLSTTLEGTGIRGQAKKIDDLCAGVARAVDSVQEWESVLEELEHLSAIDFDAVSSPVIPDVPRISAAGFSRQDIEKVARKLKPEGWLEISLTDLNDSPAFEYKQREGEYIKFSDASAGQQATALLRVLLHQSGPPLIIDQPEEDLDNQVILQIVEEIWTAKSSRQIIFTSHNANIVVNGDADLVVCCDYRTTGDQSGGRIKCQGAIDVEEIRKEITTVMEGGKDAFRMRKDKYGF
ncbi:MAG TPA: AAA family ATPase [Phycisphaerae bacterium]|nr:AAA family ATPase [Phycisphaerae bacterium]